MSQVGDERQEQREQRIAIGLAPGAAETIQRMLKIGVGCHRPAERGRQLRAGGSVAKPARELGRG